MITNIIDCANQTPYLKTPDCAFRPHRIDKIIGWKKDVSFDPTTDSFDDAKFTELAQCGKMWAIEVPTSTSNTPDATYETIEGLDKLTSIGIVDYDFALRCLSICEMKQYQKLDNTWNLAFVLEDIQGNQKVLAAQAADGTIKGFDVNVLSVKNSTFGNASAASTLTIRVQFSKKGTRQFNSGCNVFDFDVDPCDYNVGVANIVEVNALDFTGNILTVEHRILESCDGSTPIEGVGVAPADLALYATSSSTYIPSTTITPDVTDPSIVVATYDLNGTTVLGTNPFTTVLYDTTLGKPVVELNDCFYTGSSGEFSI